MFWRPFNASVLRSMVGCPALAGFFPEAAEAGLAPWLPAEVSRPDPRTAPAANVSRKSFRSSALRMWLTLNPGADRSEEHTSELQSLMRISYAVFCLKKKNTNKHK